MNPNQGDNPLSDNYAGSKSQFIPKRPNPYFAPKTSGSPQNKLSQSAVNPTFASATEHKKEGAPLFPKTTTYNNPFAMKAPQSAELKPKNPIFASPLDASTTSSTLSQSSIVSSSTAATNPRTESDGDVRNLPVPQKRNQPLLFSQGLNIPVQQPAAPKKEPLRGIYAFFGSETLPANPKKANTTELPQGLEAIPLIFKNHCYRQGAETISNFIKKAANADEKMYFRIIKIICIMKLHMWDKIILEFSALGNLDKLIFEPNPQVQLPYHLRLIFALFPYISSQPTGKSHTAAVYTKTNEEKTVERLFSLLDYCEKHIKASPYPQPETCEVEAININSICDIKISEQKWATRMIRTATILLEILLSRSSSKVATEFLNNMLAKFPNNTNLLTYQARLHLLKGDFQDSASLFEQIGQELPQDEFLEMIQFNSFLKSIHDLDYTEATRLLNEMKEKFPQYSVLIKNNLFYVQFAECKIKEAMETLETFIKTEPWNMNDVVVHNLLLAYDFYYADSKERRKIIREIVEFYGVDISKEIIDKDTKAT